MRKTFDTYLLKEIKRIARQENLSDQKAFLFWFAIVILELTDDAARESISVEGANDKGIDLFWVDEDEGRVIIAQGKFSSQLNFRPKIAPITKLESSINWLTNPETLRREGKADLAQAAEDYIKAIQDGYGVELWFFYTGPKCANIDKHIVVYNQNPDNLNKRRAIRHYDIDMLCSTWEEIEGASRRINFDTISAGEGKYLRFDGVFGEAVVASIPGSEIVRLCEKNGERLFDRNVRLFLGARKGSVNAGIAETLKNKRDSQNFWAYNNGITIVCDSFNVLESIAKIEINATGSTSAEMNISREEPIPPNELPASIPASAKNLPPRWERRRRHNQTVSLERLCSPFLQPSKKKLRRYQTGLRLSVLPRIFLFPKFQYFRILFLFFPRLLPCHTLRI